MRVFEFSSFWCPKELEAIRDALTPPLACAAAKIGDVEALGALKEMVNTSMITTLREPLITNNNLTQTLC